MRDGINYFLLTKNQIDLPAGVEITEIRPALLLIEVQTKEASTLPWSSDGNSTLLALPRHPMLGEFRLDTDSKIATIELRNVYAAKSQLQGICLP